MAVSHMMRHRIKCLYPLSLLKLFSYTFIAKLASQFSPDND